MTTNVPTVVLWSEYVTLLCSQRLVDIDHCNIQALADAPYHLIDGRPQLRRMVGISFDRVLIKGTRSHQHEAARSNTPAVSDCFVDQSFVLLNRNGRTECEYLVEHRFRVG